LSVWCVAVFFNIYLIQLINGNTNKQPSAYQFFGVERRGGMADQKLQFPNPHEIASLPGTEGWERMYPYHYQFTTDDPERETYENEMFWFYDGLHYPEPMYPFDIIWDEAWFLALSQFNTRIFGVPPVYGVDHRIINGYIYISPVPVTDPAEIEKRVPIFMERAGYYFQNWDRLHDQWVEKIRDVISQLEAIRIETLPEMEDISVVTDGLGKSKGYELLNAYDRLIDLGILCWQYHFEFLNLGYAAYVNFLQTCQTAFPGIPLQRVTQMVGGIDVIMYRSDDELKKLAQAAVDMGLADVLKSSIEWSKVEAGLQGSTSGKEWLKAFNKAKHPWFYLSTGTGWYHHDKSWNDDLDIPLGFIIIYVDKILAGENIERPTSEVIKERDRITSEYRDLLQTDEDRDNFDQNLGVARTVFPYVENHLFYVEHWFHSVFWNKVREVAAIMLDHGFINEVEDVWFLSRAEIKDALWDLVTAWATGVKPRGPKHWPPEIEWRKDIYNKFKQWTPPPGVGTAPEVIQEPFTVVLWGVTNDSLSAWAKVREIGDPDKVTELQGFPGSPGKVEGKARVCRTVAEISQLQEGEILVAPTTSPSWAPAFQKIRAAVTDVGGVMCHAAIVCREYGLPAVVGTGHATSVIKTGMNVKVDGATGKIIIDR
jgi:pyruvate,water dikinase